MPSTERLVHILLATIIARPRAVLAIFLLCTVALGGGLAAEGEAGRCAGGHDQGDGAEKKGPAGETTAAVGVEAEEDRLKKEGVPLQSEGKTDEGPALLHESGPEKAEFEGEDRPRDGKGDNLTPCRRGQISTHRRQCGSWARRSRRRGLIVTSFPSSIILP